MASNAILEILRFVAMLGLISTIFWNGRTKGAKNDVGFKLILVGFVLILLGSIIDLFDDYVIFQALGNFSRSYLAAFIEKEVGYLGGFFLLAMGFLLWLPKTQSLDQEIARHLKTEKKLLEKEAALARAQHQARIGSWRWSVERDALISSSEEYARIHGVGLDEVHDLFAHRLERVIHPDDRERVEVEFKRFYDEGIDYEIEYRIVRPDGEIRHVLEIGNAELDESGRAIEQTGTIQDITERKAAEAAVRASQQLLQAVINAIPAMINAKDQYSRYILMNHYQADLYGVTAEEAVGKTASELLNPIYGKQTEAHDKNVLATGKPVSNYEENWQGPAGRSHVFLTTKVPLCDDSGVPRKVVTVSLDITGRKKTEDALRESEERLRQATQLAGLGYCIWDSDADRCLHCSADYARIHGTTVEDYMARSSAVDGLFSFTHSEDRDAYITGIENVRQGRRFEIEYRVVTPDGETRHVVEIVKPIFDEGGRVIQEYATIQDITTRKLAEQALRRLKDELEERVEERTAELRAAQEELVRKERLAALGLLTGTVSHELRNPLGTMTIAIGAIRKLSIEDPLLTRSIKIIDRSVVRCDNIISDLLDYSRTRPLESAPCKLDNWLDALLDEYETPHGVRVLRDLASGVTVDIDEDRFHRVMVNLLNNACQAMQSDDNQRKGRQILNVISRRVGEQVEISVCDTGPGIAPESRDKIFEPLYSSKSFGVGLGLSLVKRIVEQHHGQIEATGRTGRGACFIIRLPPSLRMESVA
jgi:PAS domain S-box-containing protein